MQKHKAITQTRQKAQTDKTNYKLKLSTNTMLHQKSCRNIKRKRKLDRKQMDFWKWGRAVVRAAQPGSGRGGGAGAACCVRVIPLYPYGASSKTSDPSFVGPMGLTSFEAVQSTLVSVDR